MAANMPQMGGGNGPRPRPQNQQLSQLVYTQMMTNHVQPNGWQGQAPINLRIAHAMNLITNSFLALPHINSQELVSHGLGFEREAFINSPDKASYDQRISGRVQELFRKRQANEHNLQNTLSAQAAAAQAQAQAQAQMMMGQNGMPMSRMGQPSQQGFQHLQQQMQASPIPQQPQQQPMGMPMNPNQQGMQMGAAHMRPQVPMQATLANLSPQDRAKVAQLAMSKLNQTPEQQRNQLRMMLNQKLSPQQLAQLRQEGVDPLLYFFQNQILQASKGQAGANQATMQMQAQQRQMNQSGQQVPGPNGEFAPFESIMNQQKAGLMAQEAGQMVVPASSGPGRNATPQPMGGVQGPNQGGNHPGPNQQGMQHQRQQFNLPPAQQMKMDQMAAQTQAQIRAQAQAKQMQGQPGGLNGAGAVSQSPGMNTLNTPVRRTPVGMGQPEGQPQMGQPNGPFGQGLDPRFNQGNQRPQMGGNMHMNRQQILSNMLATIPAENRQQFMSMPPERLSEVIMKWNATQAARAASQQVQGGPQPQGPQFGQGNPMAQFAQGNNPGQQPNPNLGMNAQQSQQMVLQQQLNRLRNTMPGQNPGQMQPDANALMDSMDVPLKITNQLRTSQHPALPLEIKKWGQLKQWLGSKNTGPNLMNQLQGVQNMQFKTVLDRQMSQPNAPQQGLQPPRPQMPAQPAAPAANMAGPAPNVTISPQEIQQAKNHERFKGWPEENIKKMLIQMKMHSLKARANGQMPGNQMQGPQASQPAPANMAASAQPPNVLNAPQRQQNPAPDGNAAAKNNRQSQNNRPPQSAPAAVPKKNSLKRASTDDVVEVPNPSSTPVQRPTSQQTQAATSGPGPQMPQLTPQQLASMPPEQRAKFEAMVKSRQAGAAGFPQAHLPEEMQRLKAIGQEEHLNAAQEQLSEIPMTREQYQDMAHKIQSMVGEMSKLSKVLGRWYTLTHDDARAKMFFKMRLRLIKQFVDGEKMTVLKDTFSVKPKELEGVRAMLESMAKDVASSYPQGMRKNANQSNASDPAPQQGAAGHTATPPTQPTPLNAANLEKQTQALNKMHQRSASKGGQPPAAPTTSQPPFSFGGAQSPNGQPTYAGKPALTQENLHLPARKKARTQSGLGSGGPSANASPQVPKLPTPEMTKRPTPTEPKVPAKPQFQCPEESCDAHNIGFATEEAQRNHIEEEHVKPNQDPFKFATESLAAALGLDPNGNEKKSGVSASPMASESSKQGQTPTGRAETTPMSRTSSMKRQGSAAGHKPNELIKTIAGKTGTPKPDSTAKAADGTTPVARTENGAAPPAMNMDNTWSMATIDPQDLFQNFAPLDMGGGGAISDMNVYRSITPNDTPESSNSKDSGNSDPNSDVSEGVALNVTLDMGFDTWRPFEGGQYVDTESANFNMGDMGDLGAVGDNVFSEFTSWDDIHNDFDKPFSLDTSFYSLDTT